MKIPMQKKQYSDLENTLVCASWLVEEFEKMGLHSIAKIFQGALDDSIAWLNTMPRQNSQAQKYRATAKIREAQVIRDILVKYATIQDPIKRKKVLEKMKLSTK